MRRALEGLRTGRDDRLGLRLEPFIPFGVTDADSLAALIEPLLSRTDTFAGMRGLERAMGPTFPLPDEEPGARVFYAPIPRWGVKFALPDGSREGIGFVPFMSEGVRHVCEIEGLTLGPDRLQAVVHGAVGALEIAFYDPDFAHTRHQMRQGSMNEIVFSGLCLDLQPAVDRSFEISDPAFMRAMNEVSGQDASEGPIRVQTDGMAAIVPSERLGPDFYSVRGPVVSVRRGEMEWLGQGFWRVRVVAARDVYDEPLPNFRENADFEIDLFLTDEILGDRPVPLAGDDVEALVWLQGRLWIAGLVKDAAERPS